MPLNLLPSLTKETPKPPILKLDLQRIFQINDNRLEQIQTPKNGDGVGSRIVRYIDEEGHFVVELTALKPGAVTARRVHCKKDSGSAS